MPKEFSEEVVRAARRRDQPLRHTAHDFGISESCQSRWLMFDEIESGDSPDVNKAEAAKTRGSKTRNKILNEENLILRRPAAFFAK